MQDRITCKPNENSGPVNKISTEDEQRIINAITLLVLSLRIGLIGEFFWENFCLV
jgi:hypothetical protein